MPNRSSQIVQKWLSDRLPASHLTHLNKNKDVYIKKDDTYALLGTAYVSQ